jgi:spore coat polysaccharide biosynthesis predicted glycosyltransferase SpsG|tara:strand:- start:985 stop:1974 length:990 start_codon:yes stop_codon:yes gene_type:complete
MNKEVFFLIGFSNVIGTGHLFRSLNLAKYIKKKGKKIILIEKKKGQFKSYKKICLDVFDRIISKSDIKNFIFNKDRLQTLVIDDPNIQYDEQKILKKNFFKTVLFQDIPKKNICDILINHNIISDSKKKYKILSKGNTKLFLGEKYFIANQILKKNFQASKENKIKSITIFFGGLANNKYNEIVLKALKFLQKKNKLNVNCVLGVYSKKNALYKNKYPDVKFYKNLSQRSFYSLLKSSNYYIGSGGTSLFEALKFQLKSIVFCTAKNHYNNCINLSKRKIIIYIQNLNYKDILNKLNHFVLETEKSLIKKERLKKFSKSISSTKISNYL